MDNQQIKLIPTTEAYVGLDANGEPMTYTSRLDDRAIVLTFEEAETRATPSDILELPNGQRIYPPSYASQEWIAWKSGDDWISAPSLSELVALL